LETAVIKVDLPAFGMPSRPTSASTLSSSLSFLRSRRASPASSAAGTVDALLKRMLPKPPSPPLAWCDFARLQQLDQHVAGFGVGDDGAHGHLEVMSSPAAPNMSEPMPVLAPLGLVPARVAEIHQRVDGLDRRWRTHGRRGRHRHRWAAEFLVFFVPELTQPFATIAGGDVDKGFVDEFHGWLVMVRAAQIKEKAPRRPQGFRARSACQADVTQPGSRRPSACSAHPWWRRTRGRPPAQTGCGPCRRRHWCRVEPGAALAHDDGTCAEHFTAEDLHTEHLGLGIAPVARRAAAFFLCHGPCAP
jgi:hypothetical protein